MTVERWLVVHTHRGRERWAAENVARQGCRYYLPCVEGTRRIQGRRIKLGFSQPLFPGYLFVLPHDDRWHFLQNTFGVSGVLMNGEGPACLNSTIINELRRREDGNGLIVLPSKPKAGQRFTHGAPVRVIGGVLSGYQGIYQSMSGRERVSVLLDYLGRKTLVLIADDLLDAVG